MEEKSGPPPGYTDASYPSQQQPYPPQQQPYSPEQQPYPPQQQPYPLQQQQPQPYLPENSSQYPQQQYVYPAQQPQQQYMQGQEQGFASNTQTTVVVSQPQAFVQAPVYVENYAALSWFACLCCCWPIGIAAIVKSSEVNSAMAAGDFRRAQVASSDAKKYAIIAIICGLILVPLIIVGNVLRNS
ncbi:uncharacterized protein LOC130645805 isoform X2 [Hydractinia symbiolongicarpus]|nr:uncharacterized protein LOC130645805 isoform X2 [Hydractinia symbiolongicarpus]XP_057307890.1 uncharacterized protein LOC130645805 isoform X2 [Hydractinia symbiolongicarpus]XP_057307891.1 uncharacterized protein LOC130645805 isoform X2 [Hydractinia symbiolongicarpus]XP_057307892.1 uncharacterized protein LOC130645805 isoform X2 [Hydractinia symbiolongicarpus]XP_057307893.1 uncharacterized protein LOC130645805 isoform X2 [Hydractinia symbiolongicarpus]